jgi:4-amino-4-deoxy-L-arabinose transferase-like glycosyltransferase
VPTTQFAREKSDLPDTVPLFERRWWPVAAGGAAVWVALVQVMLWWLDRWPVPRALWGDEKRYLSSAMKLLSGDPLWWPEPLWPPLYPQFLAGLVWLGRGSLVGIAVVQSVLLAATAAILGDLTRRLSGSRAAGIAVAVLTLGYPPLVAFSHYLWPEVLHLFLFSALLWLLAVRGGKSVWCAVAGVVLGLSLLSKSLLLPFVPVLLVAAFWGSRPREAAMRTALVLSLAVVTVAPTVVANARRTGMPMIANSAAFNIWVGLNDVGRESFEHNVVWREYRRWIASADNHVDRNRILRTRIRDLIRVRGLPAVLSDQLSKQWFRLFNPSCYLTDQLPGGAARERVGTGYPGVGPRLGRTVVAATVSSILVLLVIAPAGLILGGCRGACHSENEHQWHRTLNHTPTLADVDSSRPLSRRRTRPSTSQHNVVTVAQGRSPDLNAP